jgi:hypothetical protein
VVGWVIGGIVVVIAIIIFIFIFGKSDTGRKKDGWPFRNENAERAVCCVSRDQPEEVAR